MKRDACTYRILHGCRSHCVSERSKGAIRWRTREHHHLETDAFQVKQAVLHMNSRMMFKELIQEDFISKIISHVTRGCNCVAHVTVGSTPSNPHFISKL
jgi:hypothetical protein